MNLFLHPEHNLNFIIHNLQHLALNSTGLTYISSSDLNGAVYPLKHVREKRKELNKPDDETPDISISIIPVGNQIADKPPTAEIETKVAKTSKWSSNTGQPYHSAAHVRFIDTVFLERLASRVKCSCSWKWLYDDSYLRLCMCACIKTDFMLNRRKKTEY